MIKDAPRMIYHIIEPPMIVQTVSELEAYLDKGWSMSPVEFSEANALAAKIAYHESEADRLRGILEKLDYQVNDVEEVKDAPVTHAYKCDLCDHTSTTGAGIAAHKRGKHKEAA